MFVNPQSIGQFAKVLRYFNWSFVFLFILFMNCFFNFSSHSPQKNEWKSRKWEWTSRLHRLVKQKSDKKTFSNSYTHSVECLSQGPNRIRIVVMFLYWFPSKISLRIAIEERAEIICCHDWHDISWIKFKQPQKTFFIPFWALANIISIYFPIDLDDNMDIYFS